MSGRADLGAELGAAMSGAPNALAAADQLCRACVDLLPVDGAAISLMHDGASRGTFGSSGRLSRHLDELQFTFGEGPCLDAVRNGRPVLAHDLAGRAETRWPALTTAMLDEGINAIIALPVTVASSHVGALDLFGGGRQTLGQQVLAGGLLAAELAALPLLDLMSSPTDWAGAGQGGDGWDQLASLQRVEVYQATGMVMDALGVEPAEALVRLRAHAYAHGRTASEVAWAVVERRLTLTDDAPGRPGPGSGGSP